MKNKKYFIFILILTSISCFSQPGPPSPVCWPPPCVPIDGGISLFTFIAALIGFKSLKSKKLFLFNSSIKFISLFIPLIILWFFFYHYIYKIDQLLNINSLIYFSTILSQQSNFILELLGFNSVTELHGDMIVSKITGLEFSHGVWIGEPCNGIKVFGLFSIFIISYRGKLLNKLIYIPIGVLALHFLNVLRIGLLTYISSVNPYILDFNHNVTFQLVIYGSMLGLWYLWIIKFSTIEAK